MIGNSMGKQMVVELALDYLVDSIEPTLSKETTKAMDPPICNTIEGKVKICTTRIQI